MLRRRLLQWALTGSHRYMGSKQTPEFSTPHTVLSIVQDSKNSTRKKRKYVVEGSATSGFSLKHTMLGGYSAFSKSTGILDFASRRITNFLKGTFLPSGYPNTVGENHLPFVGWQTVANFCVAANAVISSTFLLYSVGLGAGAIATAGAMNWVLKDGLGQMGTLLFGKAIAHNFDIHSKSWFFLSMVKMNVAIGLEIITILMPQYFLFLGSLANTIKGLAFMANGSTRSVFNLSFVRDNNIADVTAKGTSQFICASMFGTVAGASLCGLVGQDTRLALGCYSVLAFTTMWSAFATVKTIPLSTLNNTRLQLLCEAYLTAISSSAAQRADKRGSFVSRSLPSTPSPSKNAWEDYKTSDDMAFQDRHEQDSSSSSSSSSTGGGDSCVDGMGICSELERTYDEYQHPQLPSPVELAAEDPPLPWLMGDVRILNPAIIVGRPFDKLLEKGGAALLAVLLSTFKLSRYIVLPCGSALNVVLHHDARPRDICQVYLQACLLRRRMRQDPSLGQAAALHDCAVERLKNNSGGAEHMNSSSSSSSGSNKMEDSRPGAAGVSHQAASGYSSVNSSCSSNQGRYASGFPETSQGGHQDGDVLKSTERGGSSSNSCSRSDLVLSDSSGTDSSGRGSSSLGQGIDSRIEPQGSIHESSSRSSSSSSSCSNKRSEAGTSYGAISCDAGAPLADNSGTQGEGMEVTWYNEPGIFGVSCGDSDPKFWVASTGASSTSLAELRIALQDTLQTAERLTTPFMAALESSGWQLGKIVVEANRRRARW